MIGDQKRAKVSVQNIHDTTPGNESYALKFTADSSLEITNVSVSGPGIKDTSLVPEPDHGGFKAELNSLPEPVPVVGTEYAFLIEFADGNREIYQDTIKSWEAPADNSKIASYIIKVQS